MEIAVLGGGYAGVGLVRRLERQLPDEVALLLVDDTGDHLVQHELHRLLRFPGLAEQVRVSLSDIVDRTELVESRVTSIDEEDCRVRLETGERIDPDVLAICLGAVTATDIVPGVETHGQPLKRIEHAETIRSRFQSVRDGGRIVVGGAGLAGVQVAGELAAARDADGRDLEVTIIEQAEHVAPRFPRPFREAVADSLDEAGVTVWTDRMIRRVDAGAVELTDGTVIDTDQVVWTGGITGPNATGNRRLRARSDLRVADRTFAVGDAALVIDDRGERVPAAAQTAVRQAVVAATNIERLVSAELADRPLVFEPRLERYIHASPGWVVSVGDDAVAMVGDEALRGPPARAVKASVNARYLGSVGEIQRALEVIADGIGWAGSREP